MKYTKAEVFILAVFLGLFLTVYKLGWMDEVLKVQWKYGYQIRVEEDMAPLKKRIQRLEMRVMELEGKE